MSTRVIHKATASDTQPGLLHIPTTAEVLAVGTQADRITVWYIVPTPVTSSLRELYICGTGWPLTPGITVSQHCGSVVLSNGGVWHLFDLVGPTRPDTAPAIPSRADGPVPAVVRAVIDRDGVVHPTDRAFARQYEPYRPALAIDNALWQDRDFVAGVRRRVYGDANTIERPPGVEALIALVEAELRARAT
jgi:hypothetical protein